MAYFDVLIKNGMIFNGKGDPAERADIGINRDKIDEIGDLQKDTAREIIDAGGKYICPGFVDITSHSDTHWTLFTEPSQESLIRQGITTILGGNCGFSITPIIKVAGLKGIKKWTDISNVNVNWETVGEMLDELERHKLGVNFATLVGLNTLQDQVEDARQLKFLLEKSLKEGAFGVSTNLGLAGGVQLNGDDLSELLKLLKKNEGIAKHHLEDEGKNILPALSRLISLARETETKTVISHFKILGKGSWSFFGQALEMMRNARHEGVDIFCDFFPYERTGSNLFSFLPLWLTRMNEKEIMEILRDKNNPPDGEAGKRRQEVIDYLKSITLHYDKITIASSAHRSRNIGKTIAEISVAENIAPEEVILNLLETNNLGVSIFSEVINIEHVFNLAKEDYSVVSSDGVGYSKLKAESSKQKADLPHPRSFGAFPKALKLFAREKQILPWEAVIHKMTGLPAGILGIKDRGVLEVGKKADIIIFNPNEISDYSTYDSPSQFSKGIESVLVNGSIILADNEMTGRFAGRVLRKK